MRHLRMNKKGFESTVALKVVFILIVLVILLFFSKTILDWIGSIIDKLFGF